LFYEFVIDQVKQKFIQKISVCQGIFQCISRKKPDLILAFGGCLTGLY